MLLPSFIYPEALWLLLVIIPLWALAFAGPRRLSPGRFWASLALRTAIVVALVLSLAGTQLVQSTDHLTTIFLIDSSDSITPSDRARAETFVQQAMRTMGENDQAALVVFGQNALVERAPSTNATLGSLTSVPVATGTNIEEAIQLGMALFPADTQKRLVLLSDGSENTGTAQDAASLAAARTIPLDIVELSGPHSTVEVLINRIDAPDRVRSEQSVPLVIDVESTTDQSARLRVFADQEQISDQQVTLQAGNNQFRVTVPAEGQGFRRYRAEIEPTEDGRLQNNEAAALVQVQGPPRVLLVEGKSDDAHNLLAALEAANVMAEMIDPAALPTSLTDLSAYEALILVNVPARDLPVKAMALIPSYVRDLGKGLVMIGGDQSYGVGGYGRTPIEEALPVYMDVRNRQERPDLAIAFVIDKSGSMDACHCAGPNRSMAQFQDGGERKVDIAKEAVIQASALLGSQDTIGVIAFDSSAHWVLPATTGSTPDQVADAVSNVRPRGNTNVRAGLESAQQMLNETEARIKHVILLTDGWGNGGSNIDLAETMNDEGITISVVAAGGGSADFLEDLALAGGGRYYAADDMSTVPQIFLQETIVAAGNYIIEEPFLPAVAADSPVLQGFEAGLPILHGYNGSTIKDTARSVLVSNDQSPVMAQWNYGLGRSIAWTSDMKGQWASDWVTWADFPRFTAQMVDWVLPADTSQGVAVDIETDGLQTVVTALVQDDSGQPRESLELEARLIPATSTSSTDEPTEALPIPLTQVAPGEYRTGIANPAPGSYLIQIIGHENDQPVLQEMVGFVVPYSPEYRQNQFNPAILEALRARTDGNVLTEPAQAFTHNLSSVTRAQEIALPLLLLALLLLPFDIAARRLLLRQRDLQDARAWVQQRIQPGNRSAQPAPDPSLVRLSQARNRTRYQSLTLANNASQSKKPDSNTVNQGSETVDVVRELRPESHDRDKQSPMKLPQTAAAKPAAPSSAQTTASDAAPPTEDPLERLRKAKERARKRVRGEE
ncbi:MAG: VWA domain-containing protein [Chloroflexaceae bacterium]|nr:VWA domain-containing protein [Chloroflexaceae bacterium]